jgi:hypothetical protein
VYKLDSFVGFIGDEQYMLKNVMVPSQDLVAHSEHLHMECL